ncbi:Sugar-specific transcriptional regulator TrmB [Halogeometricum borinquense DSM 11551]|uniref:Sugar-specific transcriptional regulator TrmB n=1 Tax=Halogeometricum borinquense (strain ATCC 700274 / DSM 11551 / JCM 10706 / KCTC 4070 / PR3) TaxID=469382 RepID=E4NUV0_HALBP|nr:ArsR family transcriptional regulator [Halogeometricum borinquense]ADQ68939.1 Sugar-specific transcriptional regulator TrmB [Halogeometricum borinquense DSM 11551]ELY28931.1 Sugar-specific transcriptional regulator TrmB [Halogeometricum borinquense DSM 11551]
MSTNRRLDPDDVVDAVSRRAEIMQRLLDGPQYNRDIRESVGVSRSTAYKAISELEEMGLARRGSEGYELTATGRLLFEEYRRFRNRVEAVCHPAQLLSILPADIDINFEVLEGAEVSFAERYAPNRPVTEIADVIRDADVLRGTGPVVLPSYVELFHDQFVAGELEAELVFERAAFDHLSTDYADEFSEAVESGALEVRVTDEELPFGLLMIEKPTQKVGVIVYDRGGELRGFILNDSENAVEWGEKKWERYREAAAPLTPGDN